MSALDADAVGRILAAELRRLAPFRNYHGITQDNLQSFLVSPYALTVDPDDLETVPREMWVVLEERPGVNSGYLVVYDPLGSTWGVAERSTGDNHVLTCGAASFAEALDSM